MWSLLLHKATTRLGAHSLVGRGDAFTPGLYFRYVKGPHDLHRTVRGFLHAHTCTTHTIEPTLKDACATTPQKSTGSTNPEPLLNQEPPFDRR